jgi:hypothetical protein
MLAGRGGCTSVADRRDDGVGVQRCIDDPVNPVRKHFADATSQAVTTADDHIGPQPLDEFPIIAGGIADHLQPSMFG